jgi:hypothetical protein
MYGMRQIGNRDFSLQAAARPRLVNASRFGLGPEAAERHGETAHLFSRPKRTSTPPMRHARGAWAHSPGLAEGDALPSLSLASVSMSPTLQ